jgi:signal peptidase I
MDAKKALILALATALILRLVFFDIIVAQGHSMEPAIKNGEILLVSRLRYGIRLSWQQKYLIRWAQPKVGEIVVFYTPTGEIAVKRCTALINGDRFYAEGDNGLTSYDSRSYGAVPVDNIIGKVLTNR